MEKKLSEYLKLVISDCHLVRKLYHDDSILTSSEALILCDQLAGLSAIDFRYGNSSSFSLDKKSIFLVFVLNKMVRLLHRCY